MSNELTNKVLLLFYRGAISNEDAKNQVILMHDKGKITDSDFKRAMNIIP